MTEKFCINCRNFRNSGRHVLFDKCQRTGPRDLVTGETYSKPAHLERITTSDTCGEKGRFFEQADPVEVKPARFTWPMSWFRKGN